MRDSGTVSIGPNFAKSTWGTDGSAPPPPAGAGPPPSATGDRALQIFPRDAAFLARPLDLIEIEAKLARQPPNRGASEHA